jgi:3-isopropylmalate/(R)-2-methylmalate dehydratase large subunit
MLRKCRNNHDSPPILINPNVAGQMNGGFETMNEIESIIAKHAAVERVVPGEIVEVTVDFVMTNDATTALIMVMDHYTPSNTVAAANTHKIMRDFAKKQAVKYVYDGVGICHQVMLEEHIMPGQLIIGADSHTCSYGAIGALSTGMGSTDIAVSWLDGKTWLKVPETIKIILDGRAPDGVYSKDITLKIISDLTAKGATYKAIVFEGEAVSAMSIAERMTLCNMVIEAGGKFAYIKPDEKVKQYLNSRGRNDAFELDVCEGGQYERIIRYDISNLEPQIACPHFVDNICGISEVLGFEMDEFFIGACTNGRYEDLKVAADILKGKKIAPQTRLIVTPASREIYKQAARDGLLEIFMDSGAMICNPGCSTCFGATEGLLGDGERLLTTANRNFIGRVGSKDSSIYLASPAVVAASAVTGKITDPREVI